MRGAVQPSNADPSGDPFWSGSTADVLARLAATPAGLSVDEVARRLRVGGPNVIATPVRQRMLGKIVKRLIDPLIAILIIAAFVSGVTGDWASCIIILAILSVSIGLESVQEHSAETAVEALKRSVAVHATVRRTARRTNPGRGYRPGDVVELPPATSRPPTASCWKPRSRRPMNRC